jgi:hypothetical protein
MATELKMNGVNWALRAAAIVGVMYGIGFLLMPSAMFQLSGDPGVPTNPGWVRWAGGVCSWYCYGPLARIGRLGKGAAVHSWSCGSLYSIRPCPPL